MNVPIDHDRSLLCQETHDAQTGQTQENECDVAVVPPCATGDSYRWVQRAVYRRTSLLRRIR